jgi:hypothetical protein
LIINKFASKKNYPSNSPAKNHPGEECSGEEYSILAKNKFSEELSGEETS